MSEQHAPVPRDADELLRELEATAVEQKRLTAELDLVKARRTELVDAVRDRRLLTWRRIAEMFGMTENALQLARKARRARGTE